MRCVKSSLLSSGWSAGMAHLSVSERKSCVDTPTHLMYAVHLCAPRSVRRTRGCNSLQRTETMDAETEPWIEVGNDQIKRRHGSKQALMFFGQRSINVKVDTASSYRQERGSRAFICLAKTTPGRCKTGWFHRGPRPEHACKSSRINVGSPLKTPTGDG